MGRTGDGLRGDRPGRLPGSPAGLTDSKRLSPARRAAIADDLHPSPAHQEALAALGPTPHHRLSWSYLDDLPRWRHLKRHRPDVEGQLSLL